MIWRVKHRDRRGRVSTVGHYETKVKADARVARIGNAQLRMGAYHLTSAPGLARASWRDGSYIETWRAGLKT